MARDTGDSQVKSDQGRNSVANGFRALTTLTLVSVLLAGCSAPVARQTAVTGVPIAGDAQAMADQTHRFVTDAPRADLAIGGSTYHAEAFCCLSRPDECRVRDLRTPWEARRYLMPDGTLSAPPGSETPR